MRSSASFSLCCAHPEVFTSPELTGNDSEKYDERRFFTDRRGTTLRTGHPSQWKNSRWHVLPPPVLVESLHCSLGPLVGKIRPAIDLELNRLWVDTTMEMYLLTRCGAAAPT